MRQSSAGAARRGGILIGLLLACLALAASGATARVAELERLLAQAPAADKPRLLAQLSAEVESEDMNRAWDLAQQARREAVNPADEIRADTRIASLLRRRGSYAEALTLAGNALERATALEDKQLRAEAMLIVANTHDSLSDFPAALDLFRTLIPLVEELGDLRLLTRAYNTLGVTYVDAGQPDRARQSYETAIGYATRSGDQRMQAGLLNNIGNLALEAGDAPRAREYHEKALALREAAGGDVRGIADSNQNLAEVALLENNPAAALPYLERAIALHTTLGLKRNLTNAQLTYATALRLLNRLDEVPPHLQAALRNAEALKSQTILARVYKAFSLYHEARGDLRNALDFERKLATATDAAIGERSRQRLDTLQARYDAERRQHEIDVLRRDQQVQQAELETVLWQRYSLGVILLGVIAVGVTLISRQRIKHRAEERILAETRAGRAAAETAHELKTRLLHITSHDIRGPLTNILHVTDELQSELSPGRADERLEVIRHEAENVLSLAQEILDTAALEKTGLTVHAGPMDFAVVIRDVIGRMQWRAALKQQVIEFPPVAEGAGHIEGDPHRLHQVVTNLVGNALKYSPPGKPIGLRLERLNQAVRLTVTDEGPGIAPEEQARLFVPFARLSNRPGGGESSHGLGLSIAYELVRLHSGHLSVISSPGVGSTFVVELPLTPSPDPASDGVATRASAS